MPCKILILKILILCSQEAGAQHCYKKSDVLSVLHAYTTFFDQIKPSDKTALDPSKMKAKTTDDIVIENDIIYDPSLISLSKLEFNSWEEYANYIDLKRITVSRKILDIEVKEFSAKYAETAEGIFIWVEKVIKINVAVNKDDYVIDSTFFLKLELEHGSLKIRRISKENNIPADEDGDGVPDKYDKCDNSTETDTNLSGCFNNDADCDGIPFGKDECEGIPGTKGAHGCPDKDGDDIRDSWDYCQDKKGPSSNDGCPNPPFSRLDFELAGLGIYPFGSAFNEKEILKPDNSSLQPATGYATFGYGATAALSLNIRHWLGITVGYTYQHLSQKFSELGNDLKGYLRNNGLAVNSLVINQKGYSFHGGFAGISFGNFGGKKYTFKITPMYVFLSPIKANSMEVKVNYAASQEKTVLKLTPESIYLPAISTTFMVRIKDSKAKVFASLMYMRGEIPFTTDKIQFQNLPSVLEFPGMNFQTLSLSVGVSFSIHTPKNYNSDHDLKN